jgi:hypothetical protein
MTRADPFLFAAGIVIGLFFGVVFDDWRMRAQASEVETCRDGPDTKAYLSRLPGENHNAERCVFMMRYGSPLWVPELSSPLQPRRESK